MFALMLVPGMTSAESTESTIKLAVAEAMALDGYTVDSDAERSFIRLTGESGSARWKVPFSSGYYDMDVHYLAENREQQSTYSMFIGERQTVAWLDKARDGKWQWLSDQHWHTPRHVKINQGDVIRIDGFSNNGSRGIIESLRFIPSSRQLVEPGGARAAPVPVETAAEILAAPEDYLTVYPKEYGRAIKNPLKGLRPNGVEHEFGALYRTYLGWKAIERSASDGVDRIREMSDARWEGFAENNVKAMVRVYLDWPNRPSQWPEDMVRGDYSSDAFKERVLALIRKMGTAWDEDPRVAFVEMGLIGEWGEQEFPNTRDDIKRAMAAQFAESFQNKLVMIRWPNTYDDHIHNFGYHWDSFAHFDQDYYTNILKGTFPRWKTAPTGGETAYDWGNVHIQAGRSPEESLSVDKHRDFIIDRVRQLHANHLGWIANYDHTIEAVRAGAEQLQKALGYRFVIPELTYPKTIRSGVPFTLSFEVQNTGSSPFYYNWPLELSLLDPETREVVWQERFTDLDIRNWLPGEGWDAAEDRYKQPAPVYTVNQTFESPEIAEGEYIIALALLDPAGGRPSARFAIENYFQGGRHPFGKVGVNHAVEVHAISGFDDLQADKSLSYTKHP